MLNADYPARYISCAEFAELQAAFDSPLTAVSAAEADLRAQLTLSTATWGLATWEAAVGIVTDVSKPDAARREAIEAKLRAGETTTKAAIENVAAAFSGGEVVVTEIPAEYRITVKFTGQFGTPVYIDDVTAAINAVIPAHIAFSYEYRYLTVAEVAAMTIAALAETTLDLFGGA